MARKTNKLPFSRTKRGKAKKFKLKSKLNRAMLIIFALTFANMGAIFLIFTQAVTTYTGESWTAESDQYYRINTHRSSLKPKAGPLVLSKCMTDIARDWAKQMAGFDDLRHRPQADLINQLNDCGRGDWGPAAENVGRSFVASNSSGDITGASSRTFNSYLESTGHRLNIENPNWDYVGVGAYVQYSNKHGYNQLWTVHIFADCGNCRDGWTQSPKPAGEPVSNVPTAPTPSRNEKDQINSYRGDFNGDGYDDIFWYGPGSVSDSVWYGTSTVGNFTKHDNISVSGTSYVPLVGDFNGDGRSDIFWYGPGGHGDYLWYGGSSRGSFSSTSNISVSGTFEPIVGDYNGDGRDDVFWYAAGSATDYMWYFNSASASYTSHVTSVSGNYKPVPGDFNGDGRGDIFWYAPGKTTDYIWYFNSSKNSRTSHTKAVNGSSYEPVPGDFNGDGRGDVFWYAPGSTGDYVWYGNTTKTSFSSYSKSINGIYNGIPGDFNGDGRGDIFWYGPTGDDYLWSGSSTKGIFSSSSSVNVSGPDYLPSP